MGTYKSSIITGKLNFGNKNYRTTKINEAIECILQVSNELKEKCPAENARQSSWAPLTCQSWNQIREDLEFILDIKECLP